MKDLEKPYKIHKFSCKSDEYCRSYSDVSDLGSVTVVSHCGTVTVVSHVTVPVSTVTVPV